MKKNLIEKLFYPIVRGIMITFLPGLLSPLHLACYSRCQKELEEKEKTFKKVSQKMREITIRYPEDKVSQEEMTPNIKLFYDVYSHIDDLSLKELKVLRKYCCTIEDVNSIGPIEQMEDSMEIYRISRLEDTIDHHIKEKKKEKNPLPRRF